MKLGELSVRLHEDYGLPYLPVLSVGRRVMVGWCV